MYQVSTLHDVRKAVRPAANPMPTIRAGKAVVSDVRQCVMRFTPEDARLLLQNVHPRQRKLNGNRVQQYLRSMQTGKWHEPPFTFDSIAFDADGRLCNGLHRLTALSQHDKPLSFFVIIGVQSPDDMPLPEGDAGYPRNKAFVSGIERNSWAVTGYLAEWVYGGRSIARTDIQALYPLFESALIAIPRVTTHSPAAPIRAAFVFSYVQSAFEVHRQQVAEQWRAYCTVDVSAMWPSIGRLYKKIQESRAMKGGSARHIWFESAMYAIDHPEVTKINRQTDAGQRVADWVAVQQAVSKCL